MSLNDRLERAEAKIKQLESKIVDLVGKVEAKRINPESRVPLLDTSKMGPLPSTDTGLGKLPLRNASIIWNDAEAQILGYGQTPSAPTIGYNKHSHSRYSGGALDINTLELVEFENTNGIILDAYGNPVNNHCQNYWKNQPKIAKDGDVEKIGLLDITFDKNSQKWLAGGIIDVEKTYLLQKDNDGEIELDDNGNEKKAVMYGIDANTQNVVWDKNGKCWRFLAVYSDEE